MNWILKLNGWNTKSKINYHFMLCLSITRVFFSMSPLNYRSKMRVFMINYTCMIYMYLFFSFLILCVYTLFNSYQEVKIQIKINGLMKPTSVHVLLQEPTLLFKFMITEFVSSRVTFAYDPYSKGMWYFFIHQHPI